jgi:hypothetical protein
MLVLDDAGWQIAGKTIAGVEEPFDALGLTPKIDQIALAMLRVLASVGILAESDDLLSTSLTWESPAGYHQNDCEREARDAARGGPMNAERTS